MPKCNFCDREVPEILQPEIDQGWARVVVAYSYHDGRPIREETIAHCPDHLQEAFSLVIGRVAQVNDANIGIRLKESMPLCRMVTQHYIDTCRRPDKNEHPGCPGRVK